MGKAEDWEEVSVPSHPISGGRWVVVIVEIRDNHTGVVREIELRESLMDGDAAPSDFIWADGNYSCDCNRAIFFSEDDDGRVDITCGDERYSVRLRNKKTGRVYYDEFDR